jgi:hypothetical protein
MKKKIILFVLLQIIWVTGFSQSLSLQNLGDTFQCTNLDVRWNTPTNALPRTVWVYHLLPRKFPPEAVSNLIALCGFTEKDKKISNADEVVYKNADNFPSKQLGFSLSHGSIYYVTVSHYGPINLAKEVPVMSRMPELTTNFLSKFGVSISEIEKNTNGAPNFHFFEPRREYFVKGKIITDIEFRAVDFRRSVDGGAFLGAGTGGDGQIEFGEQSKPVKIDLSWRNLERYKSYPVVTPETIMKRIREGKAVQLPIPDNLGVIDWQSVKSLTVRKAQLCYYAGDRFAPSDWLMPLVSLWTTVDTGHENVDVEIDCPIIDETKP